jgi:hypothetical protein
MKIPAALLALLLAALSPEQLLAAEDPAHPRAEHEAEDNGPDPTRVSRTVLVKYEYLELRNNGRSDILRMQYTHPLGDGLSLGIKLPVARVETQRETGSGLGDVSVELGKVFGVDKEGGNVLKAELFFDTATRPELGNGNYTLKASYIRAFFLQNGGIFAPAWVQTVSLLSGQDRPKINLTTVDLYYVPKMADPKNLVTFDPSLNYNWENGNYFAGLAVTLGRNLGQSPFGGNHFLLAKPAVLIGGNRPNNWGVELIYKVIGF